MRSLTQQEIQELQDLIDGGNDFTRAIDAQCLAAEQTIRKAQELPEKWEGSYMTRGANNVEQCATVLRATLNPSPPRS